MKNKIIILGGSPTGLALARAFGKRKAYVILITTHERNIAQYSRYVKEHHHFSFKEDKDGMKLFSLLEKNHDKYEGALIFPDNDYSALILSTYKDKLTKHYTPVVADLSAMKVCNDKMLTYRAAHSVNMPAPLSFYPKSIASLEKMKDTLNFPVILKPRQCFEFKKMFKKKAFKADSYDELVSIWKKVDDAGFDCCISEIIEGDAKQCFLHSFYIGKEKKLLGEFMNQKIRECPPLFGTGSAMRSISMINELSDYTQDLCKNIGYTGFGMIEYKKNIRDGKYYILDFNPRPIIMFDTFEKAGYDFIDIILQDIQGKKAKVAKSYIEDVYWINLFGDMYYYLLHGKRNNCSFREFLVPYLNKKSFDVFDISDIRPFFRSLKKNLKR